MADVITTGPVTVTRFAINDPSAPANDTLPPGTKITFVDTDLRIEFPDGRVETWLSSLTPRVQGQLMKSGRAVSPTARDQFARLNNAIHSLGKCEPQSPARGGNGSPLVNDWAQFQQANGFRTFVEALPFGAATFVVLGYYWRRYDAAVEALKETGWWAEHCSETVPEPDAIEPTLYESADQDIDTRIEAALDAGRAGVKYIEETGAGILKAIVPSSPFGMLLFAGTVLGAYYIWKK